MKIQKTTYQNTEDLEILKVKEYSSFEAFEQDEHRQDVDLVAIVNKPNGMVCADLITDCKMWQTAVNRFFKALAGDVRFDGWKECIEEAIKSGIWKEKETFDDKYTGGWFWKVEDLDDSFYICLNVPGEVNG